MEQVLYGSFSPSIEQRKQFYNGPVSFKGSRMQLFLIAVTSQLDAAAACTNVLHPMEN